jgi:hypothetical protein
MKFVPRSPIQVLRFQDNYTGPGGCIGKLKKNIYVWVVFPIKSRYWWKCFFNIFTTAVNVKFCTSRTRTYNKLPFPLPLCFTSQLILKLKSLHSQCNEARIYEYRKYQKYLKPNNTVLLLCIMQLLEVAWYTLWDRTCSILYSKDHDTFYLRPINILVYKTNGLHAQIKETLKG